MGSFKNLDRLLGTLEVFVQRFSVSEFEDHYPAEPASADSIVALFVLVGTANMEMPGRNLRACHSGTMILLPPGAEFSLSRGGEGPVTVAMAVVHARLSGTYGLLDHAKVPIVEDMIGSPMIRQAWEAMRAEIKGRAQWGTGALISALMKSCILTILRRFLLRPGINPRIVSALADPRLAGALAMVLDEPGASHSVDSLARSAGLSRSTFARQFTLALGSSPMEFVAKTRLHYAATMLRSSKMPVKTIAAQIGFTSRSHFSRAFRESYGIDPRAFREREVLEEPDSMATLAT